MPMYVTPELFRVMHSGSDLSEFDGKDAELAQILSRASNVADAYCTVPMRPQRHSFLGGSIRGEQQRWRIAQTPFESAQRRIYPYHTPIKRISSFRIYVTQPDPDVADGQYVLVDPKDIMTNRIEDYFEVVSSAMTSTGLFNALIVPAIYLANPIATMDYTYGYDFEVSGEPVYPTDGLTYRSLNNWWTDDAVTVYESGAEVDASEYTVDRTEGTVTFQSPPAIGASVTVDYHHRLPEAIRDAVGMIASYEIEEAALTAKGMSRLNSIKIAEVSLEKTTPREQAGSDVKSWLAKSVPRATTLLDDFSNWRVAA